MNAHQASRRGFLKQGALAGAALSLGPLADLARAAAASEARKPNVIYIMADDLGWQDVGFAGAKFFETPHIDKLAAQSMVFKQAYTCGPNCSPTRACLMSGMYTPRHHIYQPGGASKGVSQYMKLLVPHRWRRNKELEQKARKQFKVTNSLDPKITCVSEVLKTAGYTTARLGKWHLGQDVQGFDVSSSDGEGGPGGSFYGDIDVAEQLTDRSLKFIEQNKDGPFFLYLCHWDVHTPIRARKAVVEKYRTKLEELPEAQRKQFDPTYAAMIEAVDQSVGRIVKKVDELGIAKDTLIIFTSDNGGVAKYSQLAPLRSCKGSLFEGGVRVPAAMRWTGTIQPGSTCDTPINSVDLLPTLAGLAGAKLPTDQPVDGVDISPLMHGKTIKDRAIFWHYPMYLSGPGHTIKLKDGSTYTWRGVPASSIRRGDYKLIEYFEDNRVELYNIKEDP
jgi:arylsulfatase A-like enzyme